jgi:RHS repeat-associated protein
VVLHQGGQLDSTTGLYTFRNRAYSSTLGKWIQEDPAKNYMGPTNSFSFERNNPTSSVDPAGLYEIKVTGGTLNVTGEGDTIEIVYTGTGTYSIYQRMYITVTAAYECPPDKGKDCKDNVLQNLPPNVKLDPEHPDPKNPVNYLTSGPIKPIWIPDNYGYSMQPPSTYTKPKPGSISWKDNPNAPQDLSNSAIIHVKALPTPKNDQGESCELSSVKVVVHFETYIYINGNLESMIPWQSSLPHSIAPSNPLGPPFAQLKPSGGNPTVIIGSPRDPDSIKPR